jgi:hypothetical protein
MAYKLTLSETELAELIEEVPSVDRKQAHEVAQRITDAGAKVVGPDGRDPVEELAKELEEDSAVGFQDEGLLPRPQLKSSS